MTIKTTLTALTATLIFATAQPVYAGYNQHNGHSDFNHRGQSIQRGIRSGRITPRELKRISKQKRKIKRLKRKFKSDGYITKRERRILNNKRSKLQHNIQTYMWNDNYRYRNRHQHPAYDNHNQTWFLNYRWSSH